MSTPVTINDVAPRIEYTAGAGQTVFPIPFEFFAPTDIVARLNGEAQALNTDFTVTGAEQQGGGTLTFTSPLSIGDQVWIYTDLAIERQTRYTQSGALPHDILERDFAKIIRILQQHEVKLNRTLRLDDQDESTPTTLALKAERANKFQAYGAAGELVYSEALDDAVPLSASLIGEYLHPRTAAEQASGIQAYTVLNGIGNVMFPQYPPGDCRRYGGDPTGVTECRNALQASINQSSHAAATGSGYGKAKWPAGTYLCNGELRVFYDGTLNPGYINNGKPCRIEIEGDGCGGFSDAQQNDPSGTVIRFQHTSGGDGLLVGPTTVSGLSGRSFSMKGVSLRGAIDGQAILRLRNVSQALLIERLTVNNDSTATPYGIVHEGSTFGGMYNQVYIVSGKNAVGGSTPTDGIGYWHNTTGGTGGNVTYINFNAKAFYTGIQIGQQFEFGVKADAGTHNFINSQAQECVQNWWFRHGAYQVTVDNSWSENADVGGAAITHDMKFSDSCGFSSTENSPDNPGRPGLITIIGGQHNSDGVGHEKFKLGDDTGVVGRDRHGPVWFQKTRASIGGSNGALWRCHNTKGNGAVVLDDVMLGGNSFGEGVVRIDSDEAQYGPIIVTNPTTFWRIEPGQWCKEDAGGTSMFGKYFSQMLPAIAGLIGGGDTTVDYTNQAVLPEHLDVAPGDGETTTIRVPKNFLTRATGQSMTVRKTVTGSGAITFEAGTVQAWGAGPAYKYGPRERVSNGGKTYFLKSGEQNAPANAPTHSSTDGVGGAVTYADGITWTWYSDSDTDLINGLSSVTVTGDRINVVLSQVSRRIWSLVVLPEQVVSTGTTGAQLLADLRDAGVIARA